MAGPPPVPNPLTLTVLTLPVSIADTDFVAGQSAAGANSATLAFSNGAGVGFVDTISNAELVGATTGRLKALLAKSYATVAQMEQEFAAAGMVVSYPQGAACFALTFTNAAPGVPTADLTTSAATGWFRIAIQHSVGA